MSPSLFDADLATTSELVARQRITVTVADAEDAYRAALVGEFVQAPSWADELRLLAEAAAYDRAHPDDLPLVDELYGTQTNAAMFEAA